MIEEDGWSKRWSLKHKLHQIYLQWKHLPPFAQAAKAICNHLSKVLRDLIDLYQINLI